MGEKALGSRTFPAWKVIGEFPQLNPGGAVIDKNQCELSWAQQFGIHGKCREKLVFNVACCLKCLTQHRVAHPSI